MKKKSVKEKLSSPVLKKLENVLLKLEKSEKYLDKEKAKLIAQKEKIRKRIKKEKSILYLKNRIKNIKKRK